jgi:hypothetical protein
LGFPCLAYTWDFGQNATPKTAVGFGPHTVTYSAAGTAKVSLRIDNNCDGGTGSTICTSPPGTNGNVCFKVDPPVSGSNNGVTYTVTKENGEPKFLTVSGSGITSVEVKGGTSSKIYCKPPFTNLTAPINPSTGQPYAISNFTICTSGGTGGGGGVDCCDQGDKPKSLTLIYNGQSCANTSTSQSTDKYSCTDLGGGPNGDPSVYIKASEKEDGSGKVYFTGNVNINSSFTVTSAAAGATEFSSNTWFLIYASQGGTLLQKVKIHTSCSAPIVAGDQFGSLILQSALFKNGTTCGPATPPGTSCLDCDKTVSVNITIQDCTPVVGKIGDFVWADNNSNGVQDPGEPGVPSVFVMLMTCSGNFVASTFTDGNGMYMFNNLPAGSYRVFFANPNGSVYMYTLKDQGGNDAKDSDVGNDGWTDCFNLGQGETNLTIDAGLKPMAPPCNVNIAVSNILCDGKGTPSTSDDTYTFVITVTGTGTSNAWTGEFNHACIGVAAIGPTPYGTPVQLGPFPAGQFSCPNTNPPIVYQNGLDINLTVRDAQNSNCSKSTTVLSPGPCSPAAPASLGDFVWNDQNQNGAQNPGEPGVQGVTVRLFKCDNTFVAQTTTNNVGFYQFTNLVPNMQYYVEFSNLPAGFQFTASNAAADNIDSDANTSNGKTDCVFLAPGENNPTIDAGIFQPAPQLGSIGDFVWNDTNQNGIQDPGEPGVPNVTVQLKNCSNAVLSTVPTDANGFYTFNNLPAGCYRVGFVLPGGFVFSPQDQGDDTKDSDVNAGTAMTGDINLAPGQNNPTIDAGIYQPAPPQKASVGDFVWNDQNKNGIQDPGEPGVQGVLVKLFKCDNTFIGQFTTNANGFYQFINLDPGSYFLVFENLPGGYQFTVKDAGDDTKDSDVDPSNGRTDCFNLASGQYDPTRDAGIFQSTGTGPAKIGDYVWFDTNANGIQDPGEPGIPNVFVILETCTGAFVDFAVTSPTGIYMFNNVTPGQYRIKFASPGTYNGGPVQFTIKDAGGDDSKDSDADWLGFTACFTVNPGETNLTYDAGLTGESPPPVCTINGSVSNVVCVNGQFTFTLIVNGTNTGDWGYDIPALGLYTLQYGQPYNLGPFPGNSSVTLGINDHDVANCHTTVTVNPPPNCTGGGICNNVTSGGTIGSDESSCVAFDPSNIASLTLPSGGSGALEYMWLKSTTGCPDNVSQAIPGASGATYDPPFINSTTWYVRLARRAGCTQWFPSNCVKKEVKSCPPSGCNVSWTAGPGKITINGLSAPNVDVKVFNAAWQTVFNCFNNCSNPTVVSNLPAGTYYVSVQLWNASWQQICKEEGYVTVSTFAGGNDGTNNASVIDTDHTEGTVENSPAVQNRNGNAENGLNDQASAIDLNLFPNPANNFALVYWGNPTGWEKAELSVLNQLGQVVKVIRIEDATSGSYRMELDNMRSGQYIVQFRIEGEIPIVRKLIINK